MRWSVVALLAIGLASSARANDWEKFYRPLSFASSLIPTDGDPEITSSSGNSDRDIEEMWRKGFAPVGFSSFNSPNSKTADAVRLGKKLKVRYVMIGTKLESSHTASMPLTSPTTTTSVSNGNASIYGSRGGYASGTYSGTTTTYGSQTSYIPITINRFDKMAVYFGEVPKVGLGIFSRELTPQEMGVLETRRALAVRFIRDGSPAYVSDILPGDIITQIDGKPFDKPALDTAFATGKPFPIKVYRNGQYKDIIVTTPEDWR